MTPPRIRPFSFDPVQRELERRFETIDVADGDEHPCWIEAGDDAHRAAELLGVNRKLVGRWRHGQGLTDVDADHCAIALGLHPIDLWPDWHETCAAIEAEYAARAEQRRQREVAARRTKRTTAAA